ncbi:MULTISPECIES: helix-turn-helix domain-containing protein [Streptomyces]|uniref:helix-turn-helix domain-containing protein n=1 Tax=Streptomyces TaxID=1883 RepID=UPI001C54EEA7|nr:helix-turn-helix transcriptional regulator [Streptomyces sp. st115]WSV19731.1 helix-turn-helix domain-containing protein [Streptomyces fimicarius]
MPPRRFNGPQMMRARRAADVSRRELAAAVGSKSQAIVAGWETEKTFPPGEKLPAIARELRVDIDVLFPREGMCDLADLRCDAGYAQYAAAEEVGISKYGLSRAERGERRLDDAWIGPLAKLYGVTKDQLLAAQRLAFGEAVPAPSSTDLPALTLKLRAQVAERPESESSPDMIAAGVNQEAGAEIIRGDQVEALLRGMPADRVFAGTQAARAIAITGLASYFGVSELHFDDHAESRVLDDLRYLASRYNIALAARGGEGGVSPAMIAVLSDLLNREQSESSAPWRGRSPA